MTSSNSHADVIPEAPKQKAQWVPPQTKLPANLISATSRLFEQGLADPRGLEYREIEVITEGGGRRLEFVTTTHGWVLPGTASQHFAVCWNGLVYPVESIGKEADLLSDISTAIKADEEMRAKWTSVRPFSRSHNLQPESYSMSAASLAPLKVCMLLGLGKAELAERVWAAWSIGTDPKVNSDPTLTGDPYLMLATDWVWALYSRAVNAHMRGDDRVSLLSAVMAQSLEKSIRQEIAERPAFRGNPSAQYYLDFLKPLGVLIQDQERRAQHPSVHLPRDPSILRRQTNAQLIELLDQAFAMQTGFPGGINMDEDSVVAELIRRGKDAVDPLLTALENDTRLTRAVRMSRPWNSDRHFMTVYETALQALRRILSIGNSDFEDWENVEKGVEGRRAVAARLRKLAERVPENAEAQPSASQAPTPQQYTVRPQSGAPLLVSAKTKWALPDDHRGIEVYIQVKNIGTRPVRSYAVRRERNESAGPAVCSSDNRLPGQLILPGDNTGRSTWQGAFNSDPAPSVWLDYVELSDGTVWGADECHYAEWLDGMRTGGRMARAEFLRILKEQSGATLMTYISETFPPMDYHSMISETGPRIKYPIKFPPGHSRAWEGAFVVGAQTIIERVRSADRTWGASEIEHALRLPIDASEMK